MSADQEMSRPASLPPRLSGGLRTQQPPYPVLPNSLRTQCYPTASVPSVTPQPPYPVLPNSLRTQCYPTASVPSVTPQPPYPVLPHSLRTQCYPTASVPSVTPQPPYPVLPHSLRTQGPEPREESNSLISSSKSEPAVVNPSNSLISTFSCAPSTSDSVRIKCREMLSQALQAGDDYIAIGAACDELGAQIEEYIFCELKNTDPKYKNLVRSRIANLKVIKNPNLRKSVLCGNVSPDRMAKMTAQEMASDELKQIRKNLTKEVIRDHQVSQTGGTQTDLFTCGKCKKK
ncbi:transcription elongation factor A protein 1-like, partial [Coregonus clupeaformis]|uniref:transcription elongation factor A protein 1-like n=1 Tax=Coregonus clupeaformis TaxID=59861 RepID=UPI001E1C7156